MNFHDLFRTVFDHCAALKVLAAALWPLIGALVVAPVAVAVTGLPNVVPGLPHKPAMWAAAGLAVFPLGIAAGLVMAGRVRTGTELSKSAQRARLIEYLNAEAPQDDHRDWNELAGEKQLPERAERDVEELARAGWPRLIDGPQPPSATAAYVAWLWAMSGAATAAFYVHNVGPSSLAKLTPSPGVLAVLALALATCLVLIGLSLSLMARPKTTK